jgi:hypothetical protein
MKAFGGMAGMLRMPLGAMRNAEDGPGDFDGDSGFDSKDGCLAACLVSNHFECESPSNRIQPMLVHTFYV